MCELIQNVSQSYYMCQNVSYMIWWGKCLFAFHSSCIIMFSTTSEQPRMFSPAEVTFHNVSNKVSQCKVGSRGGVSMLMPRALSPQKIIKRRIFRTWQTRYRLPFHSVSQAPRGCTRYSQLTILGFVSLLLFSQPDEKMSGNGFVALFVRPQMQSGYKT